MFRQINKEELKVPAHTDYLGDLRDFVARIGKKYDFPDKIINSFKLAIDEAGTNIMRHAYREHDGEGYILIRALIRKNSLTVCLIDQGKYFDPQRVKDPDLDRYVQIGKRGGLGIFIIRKLMDEIDYRKTAEGNELRLTKKVDSPLKKGISAPIATAVKSIPLSLKTKYWVRTYGVFFALILSFFLVTFFRAKSSQTETFLKKLRDIDGQIAQTLRDQPTLLYDDIGIEISSTFSTIYNSYNERDGGINLLREIALVTPEGLIYGHNNYDFYETKLSTPIEQPTQVEGKIFKYEISDKSGAEPEAARSEIYDVITEFKEPDSEEPLKILHIRANKAYLDHQISELRWENGKLLVYVLLAIAVATFVLIYVLLNPLRKLTEWVRRADHGEIGDEMDIDSSTEIGEIAQAFTEITSKFRDSQKSLADKERLQQEMQVAKEIQQTLLPADFPELEGYEIDSHYDAAREVGGDYFDFVEVDKDTLGVVVADVSGKGVPGSLVMTMIRTALRTEARGVMDAAEVLARVNKFVMGDMKKGMFVTLFYVIIDSRRRRLNYASAGHNPMILYRPSTKRTYYLNPRGFPVGIQLNDDDLFSKSIESDTIQLAEDDVLLIYTDGITEAMNSRRELFGEERFLKIIREHGHLRVKPFVEMIREELLSFTEGSAQSDDITLVAIKEKTSPEKEELRRAKQTYMLIDSGMSIKEACEQTGLTTYAYYNKFKKEFEEKGIESVEIDSEVSVEAKHISIEDKTKIFDIIKNHPEYGAKRISEELNAEKYGQTDISESKIYDELVRLRLNTRQLREAYVERGSKTKRRMKSPGTPMLTLDGRIIIDDQKTEARPKPPEEEKRAPKDDAKVEAGRDEEVAEAPPEQTEHHAPEPSEAAPAESSSAPAGDQEDDKEFDLQKIFSDFLEPDDDETVEQISDDSRHTSGTEEKDSDAVDFEDHLIETEVDSSYATGDQSGEQDLDEYAPFAEADDFGSLFASSEIVDQEGEPDDTDSEDEEIEAAEDEEASDFIGLSADSFTEDEVEDRDQDSSGEIDFLSDDSIAATDDLIEYQSAEAYEPDTGDEPEPEFAADDEDLTKDEFISPEVSENGDSELPFVEVDELIQYAGDDNAAHSGDGKTSEQQEDDYTPVYLSGVAHAGQTSPDDGGSGDEPYDGGEHDDDERERLLIAGLRYYKSRRFDEAIREFQKTIVKFPNFKEAHSILGNAYFRNRMYDNAAAAYQRVKELDPTDTTAYENMGVIHANKGQYMDAMKEWQRLLEIDSSRDDIRRKIELAARMMMKKASN